VIRKILTATCST